MGKIPAIYKKEEARSRLLEMGFSDAAAQRLTKRKKYASYPDLVGTIFGANKEIEERIAQFELEHNAYVYLTINSRMNIDGETVMMDSYLFVGDDDKDWPKEREGLKEGIPYVYVRNLGHPDQSKFTTISLSVTHFGVLRTK